MPLIHPNIALPASEIPWFGYVAVYGYFATLAILCLYGAHRFLMVFLYYRHKGKPSQSAGRFEELPNVTVQLPIYNEMYVADRLIEATSKLRYPRDRLEIQVLDDSTDETVEIVRRKVEELSAAGVDIRQVRRADRTGYKAGALENGLSTAKGEFIAVFDADFVPPEDFLERTVHHFTDPKLGMVQTRWDHLNRDYSLLTQLQAVFLDGHFMIEDTARNRSGRFINFSGTAGIWRRTAIQDAGGWEHDTLTEDLDISYRAQLKGWKFLFLPDVATPAELPVEVNGFKTQQHRWAKGSAQTARKLMGRLFRAPVPLLVKVEGFFHLTSNFAYTLVLLLSVLMLPAAHYRGEMNLHVSMWLELFTIVMATFSICLYYMSAQREVLGPGKWWKQVGHVPLLLAMGVGLSINQARAVLTGLASLQSGEFVRTPKHRIASRRDTVAGKKYRGGVAAIVPTLEAAMTLYFLGVMWVSWMNGLYAALPFQAIFLFGFGYLASLSFFQGRWGRPRGEPVPALDASRS